MTGDQLLVVCILVNWNGCEDTLACLKALHKQTYAPLSIVVVDNGSSDQSAYRIATAFPDVKLLQHPNNLGFAGGNNIGIRYAMQRGAKYVWLLNNDTEPAPDALVQLVVKARADSRLGAVASICYYAESPSTVQVWAGARVNLWTGFARNTVVPQPDAWFDSLYGASMLVDTDAIKQVGLLDEGFFHYLEETEFCLRLRKNGWRLAAAPQSTVLHRVSASTGRGAPILDRYFTASGLRILNLHAHLPRLAMALFIAARLLRRVARLRFSRCALVYLGIKDYRRSRPVTQKII